MTLGPTIDQPTLIADLETLARIGAAPDGGVTRLVCTPEYAAAQDWLRGRLTELGLAVTSDGAGNLFGHYRPAR